MLCHVSYDCESLDFGCKMYIEAEGDVVELSKVSKKRLSEDTLRCDSANLSACFYLIFEHVRDHLVTHYLTRSRPLLPHRRLSHLWANRQYLLIFCSVDLV